MRKINESHNSLEQKENIGSSEVDIYLMRHSNRFAGKGEWTDPETGEKILFDDTESLTPEGKERAREFGRLIKENHTNVISIASGEDRAAETGEDIEVGAVEPAQVIKDNGKRIINQVKGVTYKELGPQGQNVLKTSKPLINEAASKHPGYGKLDPQERASVRQSKQEIGLLKIMKDEEAVNEAAEGVAYNLYCLKELSKDIKPGLKPALPIVSHGFFNESFLKKALIIQDQDGKKHLGFDEIDEIGGFFAPAEAFKIKIRQEDGKVEYECEFTDPERQKLFAGKKISLDWEIVKDLFHKFDHRMAKREDRLPWHEDLK